MDVIDERELVERAVRALVREEPSFDDLIKRRHRKRRNQRIAAGVVGIAVFVAAVWIVTSGLSFDRTPRPADPGGATGPEMNNPVPKSAVGPVPQTDYLIDLDTGEMTPLPASIAGNRTDPRDSANEYAASPDGSRLAYTDQGGNGESQIFVANLDGTGIEQVTHEVDRALSPAWSPDGSKIAYIGWHDRDGGPADYLRDVFVLDLATGASTQLTFATREPDPAKPDWSPWRAFSPSFTPDGSSIVYETDRGDPSAIHYETEIRMVPVAGGESVLLPEGTIESPDLSPDGSRWAYAWPTETSNCVCVSNADGTGERVLIPGGQDAINGTRWSPDGARIVYWEFHSNNVSIVDFATGQVTHVAEGYQPTWLDDHTLIIEMNNCYDPAIAARVLQGCGG
jgi:dipeptidyl aminopeptidase/acylaminoacyl peptidase